MKPWIMVGEALAHVVLLVWCVRALRRRAAEFVIPLAVCSALVYENLLLAAGETIGEGDLLRLASVPRYVGHGLFTPLLVVFALVTASRAGLSWFQDKRVVTWWGAVVFGCVLGGVLFDVVALELQPEREQGLLRYVNEGAGPPIVEILTVNAILLIGGMIARTARQPHLFLGAQAMLIISLFWTEDLAIANLGEVLLLAGCVVTGWRVLNGVGGAGDPGPFAPGVAVERPADTERTRAIVRWNRRLGWLLLVLFPASYLTGWLSNRADDSGILHTTDVMFQFAATVVLLLHAAQSFRVFGFPRFRWNLRSLNGYSAYAVLLLYLLSQAAIGIDPAHAVLVVMSFTVITIHVVLAIQAARRRPSRADRSLGDDLRSIVDHDREQVARVRDRVDARQGAEEVVLAAHDLDVHLGGVQVLFDVDLKVGAGEIVALIGPNGAGKTTLLRTLAGLESPRAGRITLHGVAVGAMTPAARARLGLGLVVGGNAVFDALSVADNLALFASGVPAVDRRSRMAELTEMFPWIAERSDQLASSLSGGEQQILALTQAFLVQPTVVLIDEFSLGLAPVVIGQLVELLRAINAQGTAVLLVEQSAPVALQVAARAVVLDRGRVVLTASANELLADPEALERALFTDRQPAGR